MGVSEEMLGYILAMVSSYSANITFDGNGYCVSNKIEQINKADIMKCGL